MDDTQNSGLDLHSTINSICDHRLGQPNAATYLWEVLDSLFAVQYIANPAWRCCLGVER